MNCDDCPNYINRGPTMVPHGDTWVNAGDEWECSEGQYPEDCEMALDDSHNTVRSHGLSEQDWERADYERERGL